MYNETVPDNQKGPRGGRSKDELNSIIVNLREDLKRVEDERDNARADKTKLAAWLKLHYPEAFKVYFLSELKGS